MRIGIDGTPFQGKITGIGRYVSNIIEYLAKHNPSFQFFIYGNKKIHLNISLNNINIIQDKSILRYCKAIIWMKLFLHSRLKKDKIDVFVAGNSFLPLFLPTNLKTIFFVHDLNYLIVPKTMSLSAWIVYKLCFKVDLSNASVLISNSRATANKVKLLFGKQINIIIHPEIPTNFTKELTNNHRLADSYNFTFPYILTVGTHEPRKNLTLIITAFIKLKSENKLVGYKLVMVGKSGWKNAHLNTLIESRNDLLQIGYVDDIALPCIYHKAKAFVYTSIYEGFGIPVREALAVGTPVVTSDIEELREAGGDYPYYVNPNDVDQIAIAILNATEKNVNSPTKAVRFLPSLSPEIEESIWSALKK